METVPEIIREVGYVPLTPKEYAVEMKKLMTFFEEHDVPTQSQVKPDSSDGE
jgi:hypothetical protein